MKEPFIVNGHLVETEYINGVAVYKFPRPLWMLSPWAYQRDQYYQDVIDRRNQWMKEKEKK